MTATFRFTKYSGCGNDFVIIDNRNNTFLPSSKLVRKLCHRNYGIGADGIILLERGAKTPYRMRIFNADGSEAEMCGNGLRCLAHFIFQQDHGPQEIFIETMHATMEAQVQGDVVKISLPIPDGHIITHKMPISDSCITLHCLNTGVPHAVTFVEDIDQPNLLASAPSIRHHNIFPKGTNVNYVKILSKNSLAIRTFERGVEAETLACGTGALAAAITAAHIHDLQTPIQVKTRSGDTLKVNFQGSPSNLSALTMTGPVAPIFEGSFTFQLHS